MVAMDRGIYLKNLYGRAPSRCELFVFTKILHLYSHVSNNGTEIVYFWGTDWQYFQDKIILVYYKSFGWTRVLKWYWIQIKFIGMEEI